MTKEEYAVQLKESWERTRKMKYEEAAEEAHKWAINLGLPKLEGSEKQIRWAETIRRDDINKILSTCNFRKHIAKNNKEKEVIEKNTAKLIAWLKNKNKAAFWIEHRGYMYNDYMKLMEEEEK